MTNNDLFKLYNSLQEIQNIRMPIGITYKLIRDKQKIEPLIQALEQCRINIISKYADISGNKYNVKDENKDLFDEEINELFNTESEDIQLDFIKISDLPGIGISMTTLEGLIPIISGEE